MRLTTAKHRRAWTQLLALLFLGSCWASLTHALTATDPHVDVDASEDALAPAYQCEKAEAEEPIRVFMCADSGDYSGAHELGVLQNAMEDAEVLSLKYCQSAQLGYIRHADGHRVRSMTVTTGIGYISATLCTRSVFQFRRARHVAYASVVFIGTSGFSPMVGGWDPTNTSSYKAFKEAEQHALLHGDTSAVVQVEQHDAHEGAATDAVDDVVLAPAAPPPLFKSLKDVQEEEVEEQRQRTEAVAAGKLFPVPLPSPLNFEYIETGEELAHDGCAPRRRGTATPLAVGSVCVTSAAFLMESGYCTEQPRHSQCSRPQCSSFQRDFGTETKWYFTDNRFAQAVQAASEAKAWPPVPPDVQEGMERFWTANEAMEGDGRVAPTQPSFVTCAESTVNAINVGAERDYLCREYTAHTLNMMHAAAAGARRDADPPRPLLTAQDVVCVQAMESFGFLRTVTVASSSDASVAAIPIAVLRTASNYDMYPLKKHRVESAAWRAALAAKRLVVSPAVEVALGNASHFSDAATERVAAYTWQQSFEFMSSEAYEKFVMASFHYSVKTVTFVVSNYFFGGRSF